MNMCSDVMTAIKTQCGDLPYSPSSFLLVLEKKLRLPRKSKKNGSNYRYAHTSMGKIKLNQFSK